MQRLIVIGTGGHAKRVLDILERTPGQRVVGLLDAARPAGEIFFGYPVLGDDAALADVVRRHAVDAALVAIGDNWRRAAVAREARAAVPGLPLGTAVHPSAQVARGATIGPGAVISANAVLDCDAHVGALAIVGIGATVAHDAQLEDDASLAGHVAVGGGARVGRASAVGIGARIIHGITIGAHTVIGAGATVVRDIPAYSVAYGAPARVVRTREAGERYL